MMEKPRLSILILFLLALLLYPLPYGVILIILMSLSLASYFLGIIGLGILAIYLILFRITNILGILIISLGLLLIEWREMERNKAPLDHYIFLLVSITLGIGAYGVACSLSLVGVPLDATWLAAIFSLLLYLFLRVSVFNP
ncbi:hypothetical protein PNA2_1414 [Pyrococcus sp. NA2]|uniref:hypothetical protein n=1 Tax=Pyrococcus sp. (strain NA2) TaxID=342949 RepID=UPI000209AF18|nr:hypothetical protein [Pyrococcus sp. NA2]AEC52330.1 hypothetical protein PNA2_1414 [Pyrococcus sp. NA2]